MRLLILPAFCIGLALADNPAEISIPTGQIITPTAARGAIFQDLKPGYPSAPDIHANQAAAEAVSPDGQMLAILTSGYNRHYGPDGKVVPDLSTESLFMFDITGPRPKQVQVIPVPDTFPGLTWTPSSDRLFVSGGKDDVVLEFVRNGSVFRAGRTIRLGHHAGVGLNIDPMAGALAMSPDGARLLVSNMQNDSVSLIDLAAGAVIAEQDLRPGIIDPRQHGKPGGSFPRCVAWASPGRAYVGSQRDREIISLAIFASGIRVVRRTPVHGQPVALLANRRGTRLYAALDNTDRVAIFDTARDTLIEEFNAVAPEAVYPNSQKLGGANSNALALTPNEGTLLVSNGGENAIAVVRLGDHAKGASKRRSKDGDEEREATLERSTVIGLVPTGWYPTGVAISKDGANWYVINGKSETGPSTNWCQKIDSRNRCLIDSLPEVPYAENGQSMLRVHDQTVWQMQKAGFLALPAPPPMELARLTKIVARNNDFDHTGTSVRDQRLFSFLHEHIKHVIYVIKENRTYDQILGDLEIGNGDPRLTIFPENISPNHHAIARGFITLDNFMVSGEGSFSGWDWSTAARTNDYRERQEPLSMSGRGMGFEADGDNRNIDMSKATSAERHAAFADSPSDPDVLPGTHNVTALDGPGGEEGKGYLWDAALRRGLTVRNYGFVGYALAEYSTPPKVPLLRDPFAQKTQVFFPSNLSLKPFTDIYYHHFNPAFPDFWRFREWKREFDAYSKAKSLPNLMLVQLGEDHLGKFDRAIDGVNTPETQMADNDYALGQMVEALANSPFAGDTLIITLEDDSWDGPDHVNAFRSVSLFAGPYLRQHALVSKRYTMVNVVKTIEEILGIGPIGLHDALAAPMSEVFDPNAANWSYKAIVPDVLRSTKLPLPPAEHAHHAVPKHSAAYWAAAMAGQDFSGPDRINPVTFNRALWRGMKGNAPYPAQTGLDLRANRERVLRLAQTPEE